MKAQMRNFFEPVGSAGKKPISGDLDLAIDSFHIIRHFTEDEIQKWGFDYDEWYEKYRKIHKEQELLLYHILQNESLT